jgi:putative hydrolase of the HAD superfamily
MSTLHRYSVVFDLGRVLLHWSPDEILQNSFANEQTRSLVMREVFRHPDWLELDRGTLQERDAIRRFHERTGLSMSEMTALLHAVKDSLVPIEETHTLLRELSAHGVALYCLSNMAATTADHLRARYAFFKLFNGIVISGEIKLVKPDKAIFEHLLQRFNLEPESSIFIDDHPPNIESAARLGFKTHLFTDPLLCRAALKTQFGFDQILT